MSQLKVKFSLSLAVCVAEVASSRVARRVVARGSRDTGPRHNISYSFVSLKVANCKGYRYHLRILAFYHHNIVNTISRTWCKV